MKPLALLCLFTALLFLGACKHRRAKCCDAKAPVAHPVAPAYYGAK